MKAKGANLEFKKTHIYIFNLASNLDDPSLAFTNDWIKAFSKVFETVKVFSTKVGRTEQIANVTYSHLGGGSILKRVRAVMRLQKVAIQIFKNRRSSIVFHHMSTKTCLIVGPALRLMGVPQGLWYSHSKKGIELKLASKITNKIFSSTDGAFPLKSHKVVFVGHGIDTSKFQVGLLEERDNRILSLGRIARVKNNEALIMAIAQSNCEIKDVYLAGPLSSDPGYLDELKRYGDSRGVNVVYIPPISYDEIPSFLEKFSACYTGSPNSVDKSVIEGAMSGCFTIASQDFVLDQTGMWEILVSLGYKDVPELHEQIRIAHGLFNEERLRIKMSDFAKQKNNVENTINAIVSELSKV